jgi:hypothetical protein
VNYREVYVAIIVLLDIIHRAVIFKKTTFRILDSVARFRWNLPSWAESIELVPNSGHEEVDRIQSPKRCFRWIISRNRSYFIDMP